MVGASLVPGRHEKNTGEQAVLADDAKGSGPVGCTARGRDHSDIDDHTIVVARCTDAIERGHRVQQRARALADEDAASEHAAVLHTSQCSLRVRSTCPAAGAMAGIPE